MREQPRSGWWRLHSRTRQPWASLTLTYLWRQFNFGGCCTYCLPVSAIVRHFDTLRGRTERLRGSLKLCRTSLQQATACCVEARLNFALDDTGVIYNQDSEAKLNHGNKKKEVFMCKSPRHPMDRVKHFALVH